MNSTRPTRRFVGVSAALALLAPAALGPIGCAESRTSRTTDTTESLMDEIMILGVLQDFHDAAAHADSDRYFGHLAPDAIFIGTDATERWTKEEFFQFAAPYFSKGKGWTYHPHDCNIVVATDARTAWFDEKLRNEKYGPCRGSGVLVRDGDPRADDAGWKIAQYVLSVPIPNDLMPKVAEIIKAGK